MSKLKFILPAVIAMGGFLVSTTTSYGKAEYVKKTKKGCTYCHVDAKKTPKNLTEAGKYFKEHNDSLDGYQGK
jgi:hypothetical protein